MPDWYANDPMAQEKIVWKEWEKMINQLHESFKSANLDFSRKTAIIERLRTTEPGNNNVSRSTVKSALSEYVKRLKAQDAQKREWSITSVVFYTPTEWDSVWDSVWGSVRDSVRDSVMNSVWDSVWGSVWDSVRDSVWDSVWASVRYDDVDNYGLPLLDLLDAGCVLYGIDRNGIAHVVIVGKDGGN